MSERFFSDIRSPNAAWQFPKMRRTLCGYIYVYIYNIFSSGCGSGVSNQVLVLKKIKPGLKLSNRVECLSL